VKFANIQHICSIEILQTMFGNVWKIHSIFLIHLQQNRLARDDARPLAAALYVKFGNTEQSREKLILSLMQITDSGIFFLLHHTAIHCSTL